MSPELGSIYFSYRSRARWKENDLTDEGNPVDSAPVDPSSGDGVAGTTGAGDTTGTSYSKDWSGALAILFTFGIIVSVALTSEETGPGLRAFLTDWWPWLAGVAGLGVLVVLLSLFNKKFRRFSDANKGLLVTIGAVPLLVVLLNAISLLPEIWRDRTLAILFVLVAAILPPAMYYLFLVTRRPSLFDEYVTNLVRLGLIPADAREVDAYLQKFEATYGPIEPDKRQQALIELVGMTSGPGAGAGARTGTGDGWGRFLETRVGSLMTPSILLPLGLSTVLVGIGWLLVLPVWKQGVSLLNPDATMVGFGFAGAYFYSIQFLFRRFLRRDLRPSVYISMGQRIVLTVIGTWVLTVVAWGPGRDLVGSVSGLSDLVKSRLIAAAPGEEPPGTGAEPPAGADAGENSPSEEPEKAPGGSEEGPEPLAGESTAEAGEDETPPPVESDGAASGQGETAPTGESDDAAARQGETAPAGESEGVAVKNQRARAEPDGEKPEAGDETGPPASAAATKQAEPEADPSPRTPLVLAFLLGMFPRLLWDVLVTRLARWSGAKSYLERMQSDLPLSRIDGLSFWHEARLEEEDVESAPNLATADLVELMLNTRFAPGRIIDWIDQAILLTALGPAGDGPGKKLRSHGIRTASALIESYERSRKPPHEDAAAFEGLLGQPEGRSAIRTLADALGTNPNLRLVRNWQHSMAREVAETSTADADNG